MEDHKGIGGWTYIVGTNGKSHQHRAPTHRLENSHGRDNAPFLAIPLLINIASFRWAIFGIDKMISRGEMSGRSVSIVVRPGSNTGKRRRAAFGVIGVFGKDRLNLLESFG